MAVLRWTWTKLAETRTAIDRWAGVDEFIRNVNIAMKKLESILGVQQSALQMTGAFPNGATTPNVSAAAVWKTANSAGTVITNFVGGDPGKLWTLIAGDANTTIQNNASIITKTGANRVLGAGNVTQFVTYDGLVWREVPTP